MFFEFLKVLFINARSGFGINVFPSKVSEVFAFGGYIVGKAPFDGSSNFVMYVSVRWVQKVNRDIMLSVT